jgi:cold shock CspA family protein
VNGTVLAWHVGRRVGKIWGADGHAYLCHFSELYDVLALQPGQRVDFRPTWAADGLRAAEVHVVEGAARPTERQR